MFAKLTNSSVNGFSSVIIYLVIMSYIVLQVLNEMRPLWYYILSAALFVLAQLAWFLLGKVICKVRPRKIFDIFDTSN